MIVTFIYSTSASEQYRVQLRCLNIAQAIQRTGLHTAYLVDLKTFLENSPEACEACQKSDLLVIHQHVYGAVIKAVLLWKARGKKILVDFSEAYQLFSPDMPDYSFWKQGLLKEDELYRQLFPEIPVSPVPIDQFSWGLRTVDAASVPSMRLADDWSGTVRAFYLPDYINTDQYMIQRAGTPGKITIGISGCSNSPQQLERSGLLSALERISQKRDDLLFHFFEFDRALIESSRIPAEQTIVYETIKAFSWPICLSKLDIGIACAEGQIGARASKVRAIEYSTMKIPWLASNMLPFREMSHYGWLVQNSEEQWVRAILEVVDHLETYQLEANSEPFLYGISQDIFENVEKILTVYETVINS